MKILDGMLGFAIGDAMGVPIEFSNREDLLNSPVTRMLGYGQYNVPKGTWSDDTALSLATMDSLTKCPSIDYNDMMKRFCNWINKGMYTATNEVFDVGSTTRYALAKYLEGEVPPLKCGLTNLNSNGNGSLMRMLPIAYYCFKKDFNEEQIAFTAITTSSLTHAHPISELGCYIYIMYIIFLLQGYDKKESYFKLRDIDYGLFKKDTINVYRNILEKDISSFKIDDIKSSGYIVDTLEAVLWVILNTNSYKESIIGAINLGNDTDTVGAITGSIAGLIYGSKDIPYTWSSKLKNIDFLKKTCSKFEASFTE